MTGKKRVLVPLATGFEELEAVAVVDLLRRAGAHVVTASVDTANPVTGRNRLRVMADIDLPEAIEEWGEAWDLVVLPGGAGVEVLAQNEALMGIIARRIAAGAPMAAICAAPALLAQAGLPVTTRITSFPSTQEALGAYANYATDAVVVDGNVVTSRGPGTAVQFALACVELLFGAARAREIRAETISG